MTRALNSVSLVSPVIELFPHLAFTVRSIVPKDTDQIVYFHSERLFVYEPICHDFGPMPINSIYRYGLNIVLDWLNWI